MRKELNRSRHFRSSLFLVLAALISGCGTTTSQTVTDQLLVSDAVDRSVGRIGFHRLAGERVFLDTKYLANVKGVGFVNANYIISALRQQMVAADCLVQDSVEEADYVVEARIGALGTDGHEVTYGMPANSALSSATALLPNAPLIPAIPEVALAKRNEKVGAAKLAVFAYHRESKRRIWQSGVALAASSKRDIWLMGVGPFQRGTIYDGTKFAGSEIYVPFVDGESDSDGHVVFSEEKFFGKKRSPDVLHVDFEEIVPLSAVQGSGEEGSGEEENPKPSGKTETQQPMKPKDQPTGSGRPDQPLKGSSPAKPNDG